MTPPLTMALCGLGSAGRSRLTAAREIPLIHLAGIISRRPGVGTLTLQEVWANPAIEAVAISTENATHADLTREALNHNKHVLCDYPLTFTADDLKDLLGLAEKKQKILHVEFLSLLSASHLQIKARFQNSRPLSGHYFFHGGWEAKWQDPAWAGPPAFLTISRLMQIADWWGPFEMQGAKLIATPQEFKLESLLAFENGGSLHFSEWRRPGLNRKRGMEVQTAEGVTIWEPDTRPEGLFAKDLVKFHDRVRFGNPPYYDLNQLVRLTKVLEELAKE